MYRIANIKIALVAALLPLSIALYSCGDDALVEYPNAELVAETAIVDVDGAKAALYGVYDVLQNYLSYGCDMITYGDVRGEDMQNVDRTGSRALGFYTFNNRTPDNAKASLWTVPYVALNRVNTLIAAFDKDRVADISDADKNDILGQAYALRALFHFDLVRLFGAPYAKDKTQPGAVKADRVITASEKPSRSSVEEIYNFVVEDLTKATTLLANSKLIVNGYINFWAAEALLARVYLYMGDWDKAYTLSAHVIEQGPYTLLAQASYIAAFAENFNSESVFDVANSSADNAGRESIGSVASPAGYSELIVTTEFINLLNEEPTDVRLDFLKPDKTGADGYFAKYPGRGGDYMINNIHVIRLSEVYLNAAEAALRKSPVDQVNANKYLNAIRSRAIAGAAETPATIADVLKERRKELVGEGHRFYDIMRLGLTVTRSGGRHFLNIDEGVTVGWDNYLCVLPVPRTELDVNPGVGQTAGY